MGALLHTAGQAMNQVHAPYRRTIVPANQTPVLQGSLPATLSKEPAADSFTKTSALPVTSSEPKAASMTKDVAKRANTLKDLLVADGNRKHNAAALFKAVTGVQPLGFQSQQASEQKQALLKTEAEAINQMKPAQKLALMQQLTGVESPFSKVAEKVLVQQQTPGLKDVLNCLKPQTQNQMPEAPAFGLQAVGLGLLMLPVVCPAGVLLQPSLLGRVVAGLATILL